MNPYLIAFLIIPVTAIVAKAFFRWKASMWFIFFVYVAIGWGLAHLAAQSHFDNLEALVRSTSQPTQAMRDELQKDGAAQVFALYFGWAYAALYFLFCMWIVYTIRYIVGRFRSTGV